MVPRSACERDAARFERQRLLSESPLAFRWAAGELVRALREGEWVLLDEINLAPAETLQRLAGLLDGSEGTLTLPERVEGGGSDDAASVSEIRAARTFVAASVSHVRGARTSAAAF